MIEKRFDAEMLYSRIVHYYVDKRGYSRDKANAIAQGIIEREAMRRECKDVRCGHSMNDHIRNAETCLVVKCECRRFAA